MGKYSCEKEINYALGAVNECSVQLRGGDKGLTIVPVKLPRNFPPMSMTKIGIFNSFLAGSITFPLTQCRR